MNTKLSIIAFVATASSIFAISPASAGGLSILSGKNIGVANGGIVVAPSVDVGDVLSDNSVLNKALNGSLNNILSQNDTGILGLNILSGNDGGKKRRH
jgi:hypothetical protein